MDHISAYRMKTQQQRINLIYTNRELQDLKKKTKQEVRPEEFDCDPCNIVI